MRLQLLLPVQLLSSLHPLYPPHTSPLLLVTNKLTYHSFNKLAFIQLPVFAIFLRYKYFNTAYTRTSLRGLSAHIDTLVNPLPPAARDIWVKVRDSISYYATRPLVAGEGVPGAAAGAQQGQGRAAAQGAAGASASGAARTASGSAQPRY